MTLLEEASGNSNSKIGTEGVNDHGTTNIRNSKDSKENVCIELKIRWFSVRGSLISPRLTRDLLSGCLFDFMDV